MLVKLLVNGFFVLTVLGILTAIHPILAVLFIIGSIGALF